MRILCQTAVEEPMSEGEETDGDEGSDGDSEGQDEGKDEEKEGQTVKNTEGEGRSFFKHFLDFE